MSQEILPPEKLEPDNGGQLTPRQQLNKDLDRAEGREVAVRGTAVEAHTLHARRPRLPPGAMIPSGRWWTFIAGPEDQFGIVSVNGNQFYFPQGDWIVLDETNFQAAVNSRLPMFWMDGMELWEKTITDEPARNLYNVIGRRRVSDRPEKDQHYGYHHDTDARLLPEQQRRLPGQVKRIAP